MLLGTIYDMRKNPEMAEKHYREALGIRPDFAPAANNLAYLLVDQDKDMEEALALARQAKEKLPQDPNVMDTLGLVYYKRGLYDSAISEFNDSIEKAPDKAAVHYHLGLAYHQKNDNARARAAFEAALSLDDKFPGADEAKKWLKENK